MEEIRNLKLEIRNSREGFTLIEIVVAIFIIGVAFVGVLAFFNSSLQSGFDAKNELIAAGLAQEGPELVRNIVDYNYLNDNNWYNNLSNKNGNGNSCKNVDYSSLTSHACITANNKNNVCVDANGRYYQCNDSTQTFTRTLSISGEDVNGSGVDLDSGDCLAVSATVSWNGRSTVSNDIICKPRQ
jgi:prepilin-type N-terminal cleavage/methylation domain-containing protein